jgi:hypothetical protein
VLKAEKQEIATKAGHVKAKIVAGKTIKTDMAKRASAIYTHHLFQNNAFVHINTNLTFKHHVVN